MDVQRQAVPAERDLALASLAPMYQPIVDLADGAVVGYEALTQGSADRLHTAADQLAAAVGGSRMSAWMDWACRAAALDGAMVAGLTAATTLFVNVEPDAVDTPCPPQFQGIMDRAGHELQTIFEITERALAAKPAELLRIIGSLRAQGAGIALDDVGADWRSLALMPLIRPDVVKLDMHLIQDPLTAHGALVAEAVRAYAGESGAQIVAEGIETEAHQQRALALGATLGQGWLYGRPAPLPHMGSGTPPKARQLIVTTRALEYDSPMEAIAQQTALRVATKAELIAISRSFEQRALDTTEPCVILSTFQSSEWFTSSTKELYARLALRSAFVGAFGAGMPREPMPGVRGADIAVNERLLGEWCVILVAPHYAGALIAQDLGDDGPEIERRFRFAVLNDRDLVLSSARSLMLKMTAVSRAGTTVRSGPHASR